MSEATKTWLALSALGAGLIHVAIGASAVAALAIPLVAFGGCELIWGVAALARDRVPLPSAAPLIALTPILLWAALATVGTTAGLGLAALLPPAPMLAASALDIGIALVLSVIARRMAPAGHAGGSTERSTSAAASEPAPSEPAASGAGASRPWRFVLTLAAAAVAVSLVTVPALAGTTAGTQAVLVHELHSGH